MAHQLHRKAPRHTFSGSMLLGLVAAVIGAFAYGVGMFNSTEQLGLAGLLGFVALAVPQTGTTTKLVGVVRGLRPNRRAIRSQPEFGPGIEQLVPLSSSASGQGYVFANGTIGRPPSYGLKFASSPGAQPFTPAAQRRRAIVDANAAAAA